MVSGLTSVKAAKPVQPRTLQPLVAPQARHEPVRALAERRLDPHPGGERRTYCRRIRRLPVLFELRAGLERRRQKQRAVDPTEHIDIKA